MDASLHMIAYRRADCAVWGAIYRFSDERPVFFAKTLIAAGPRATRSW
jgi:hypothetical protein